jgi:hypothetical protein
MAQNFPAVIVPPHIIGMSGQSRYVVSYDFYTNSIENLPPMNTTEMNPEQRFQKLLTASPRHAKVVSFLWNDNNDVQYIDTITVVNRGANRHLIIFVDEYNSNGSACWGSEAKTFLERAGYNVGGSFDHLFNDYNY